MENSNDDFTMNSSGKYIPVCEYCFNDGLLWVAFDEKGNAIDPTKPFETNKKPVPQLAPCVCYKGRKQCSKAPYRWRKRNAENGLPQLLGDGTKGFDSLQNRINHYWVDSSTSTMK